MPSGSEIGFMRRTVRNLFAVSGPTKAVEFGGLVMEREWFEMRDVRSFRGATWIPLRRADGSNRVVDGTTVTEFVGVSSLACEPRFEPAFDKLNFGNGLGLDAHRPEADEKRYVPADIVKSWTSSDVSGIPLVLAQDIDGFDEMVWHLHQDLVIALGLLREGDVWLRPEEGWTEVARLRRDADGHPVLIEIKAEYLSDYLSARGMSLYLAHYRKRRAEFAGPAPIYAEELADLTIEDARGRLIVSLIDVDENPFAGFHVLRIGRTDADEVEGNEAEASDKGRISFDSGFVPRSGRGKKVLLAQLWRTEWWRPVGRSPRVRRDLADPPTFVANATGERLRPEEMSGRMLWVFFRPQLVDDILEHRGSELRWYSQNTGALGAAPSSRLHFGVNALGFVSVLGTDLAGLPNWEAQIWARHSIAPDGGVSPELLASQMSVQPAETVAPESRLITSINRVDAVFKAKTGEELFRQHDAVGELVAKAHRFRACRPSGLEALAKDLVNLMVERIKIDPLARYANPPKGEKWGGMKYLQNVIAVAIGEADARELMSPFFGLYDLRISASHIGGPDRNDALARSQVDPSAPPVVQGRQLLEAVVATLDRIADAIPKLH